MQEVKTVQHLPDQDLVNIAKRLEIYHLLRRRYHAELEQGILRMMEESGHALFHPEHCSQGGPIGENPIPDLEQSSKP